MLLKSPRGRSCWSAYRSGVIVRSAKSMTPALGLDPDGGATTSTGRIAHRSARWRRERTELDRSPAAPNSRRMSAKTGEITVIHVDPWRIFAVDASDLRGQRYSPSAAARTPAGGSVPPAAGRRSQPAPSPSEKRTGTNEQPCAFFFSFTDRGLRNYGTKGSHERFPYRHKEEAAARQTNIQVRVSRTAISRLKDNDKATDKYVLVCC